MSWVAFTILVCLAALATLLVGGWVFDYHDPNTDAAGRGLAGAYIAVVDLIGFLAIGALLVMCGSRAAFSMPWGILAVVTFLSAAMAQIAALLVITNLSANDHFDLTLRVLLPIAPALTIVFLAMSFYSKTPSTAGRLAAAIPALIASLTIFTVVGPAKASGANRDRIMREAFNEQVVTDRKRADEVSALPVDTPLEQLLPYLEAPRDFDSQAEREAMKRIQQLPSRQAQAIALLDKGDQRLLPRLADMQIPVSPEFCAAVRKCYRPWIDQFKPTPDAPYFANVERKGDSFTINARWLQQNGCDCKEELAMLEKNVRLYPDPYPKKFFIDELLRQQGRPTE